MKRAEASAAQADGAKKDYQYRCGLIKDAVQLKKAPDRVPVVPLEIFAPVMLCGHSGKEAMYDANIFGKIYLDFTTDYDVDATAIAPIQDAFKALLKAGQQSFEWINTLGQYIGQIMAAGYPLYAGGATKAAFDVLGDRFRGTTPLMMDLYRRPEKVIQAMERLIPLMIGTGVEERYP